MKSVISSLLVAVVLSLLCPVALAADVYISEFQSVNDTTIPDDFGNYSDWIELYNATGSDISLDGWYLTDYAGDLTKWQFPAVTIDANSYMLIFASDDDVRDPLEQLHTNFKLSGSGEYIALVRPDGVTVEHFFNPVALSGDQSYGLDQAGAGVLFANPTPGSGPGIGTTSVSPVVFSVAHGFFNEDFLLSLSTLTDGATIRYTKNGDTPTSTFGTIYTSPISVYDTTVIRAVAYKTGMENSIAITQTYIFPNSVLQQSNNQSARELPEIWDASATLNKDITTGVIYTSGGNILADATYRDADYAMDPDIVNSDVYGPQMLDALVSIPSISMVMEVDDIFGPEGIYPNSVLRASRYPEFEKAASLELLDPTGTDDFTVNCGSRIMGELARYPIVNQKQSFRVVFKEEYGPTKLKTDFFGSDDGVDKYDTLVLRANWGDGWLQDEAIAEQVGVSWYGGTAYDNQYLRDIFGHDAYKATGNLGVDGRFAHLYINGVYWGLYQVIERPDNNYQALHQGGDSDEYDVLKGSTWDAGQGRNGVVQDGNPDTWNRMMNYFDVGDPIYSTWTGQNIDGQFTTITNQMLSEIEQYMDVDSFIDYMITLWSINRGDFPKKNWYAACRRDGSGGGVPLEPFRFYTWDSEASLSTADSTSGPGRWYNGSASNDTGPVRIFRRLITNEDFCLRWSQRAYELLGEDGALGAAANIARYQARMDEISLAMIGESARWGDSPGLYVDDPLTVNDDWLPEANRILTELFPYRNAYVFQQMRDAGVYPMIDGPSFVEPGGVYEGAITLDMLNSNDAGSIYYTLDGSDPRLPGGGINPNAIEMLPAPAMEFEAIELGGTWSYSDEGIDYGTAWRELEFDDSSWPEGIAEFGYGDADETTFIGYGGDSSNKNMTTYFRSVIDLSSANYITDLWATMLVDDGAIVYINGVEVVRFNLPFGDVSYSTPASTSIVRNDEVLYRTYELDHSLLVNGLNVIAVEVHQDKPTGSDLSFAMSLFVEGGGQGLNAMPLDFDAHVKARVLVDGQWSIYAEEYYQINEASPIEVSEFYYHPEDPTAAEIAAGFDADDFEFIELHNTGGYQTVEAFAVLGGGVAEDLASFTLAADEYAVIVANEDAFRMRFGDTPRILGDYSGRLSNAGDVITLVDSYDSVIVDFIYLDDAPWPLVADGYGSSLNLIADKSQSSLAQSWEAGQPSPGAAKLTTSGIEGDFNSDFNVDAVDIGLLAQTIEDGTNDPSFDLNGDSIVDAADMDKLIEDILLTAYGDANLDGNVNLDDFIVIKQNYGSNAGWSSGDFNGDGLVNLDDFILLKVNYGFSNDD